MRQCARHPSGRRRRLLGRRPQRHLLSPSIPVRSWPACLAGVWHRLSRRDVFGAGRAPTLARIIRRREHIYDPGPLRSLIRSLGSVDDLADAPIPVQVVTTDLDLGLARWWTKGPAHELLYASACLPVLFPPAMIDGRRHVDGGVLRPVPVQRAVDTDASVVYVLGQIVGPGEDVPPRMAALTCSFAALGSVGTPARSTRRAWLILASASWSSRALLRSASTSPISPIPLG